MTEERIRVGLDERAYDIVIGDGLLDRAESYLTPVLKRPKTVIVSDETVYAAHGARLVKALTAAGVSIESVILPPGEATKNFAMLEETIRRLLAFGVDRSDAVIALGGGVIGDLVGFACAILKRGCRFVQIPTSLLAQVDSAVGGKTAINVPEGKNLVGAFHQPVLVLTDISTLSTLDDRHMRAGYAEIVKYGVLGDVDFYHWLEGAGVALLNRDRDNLIRAVKRSCEMKAKIVEADERERGQRALLNLGHTFGHALEASYAYSDALLHGEAVAAGMGIAADYSAHIGVCQQEDADRLKAHLRAIGLPGDLRDLAGAEGLSADQLLAHIKKDKKVDAGALTLVLMRRIGEAFLEHDADVARLHSFLTEKAGR